MRGSPPSQASMRLGLPYDFLYRSKAEQKRLLAASHAPLIPAKAGTQAEA